MAPTAASERQRKQATAGLLLGIIGVGFICAVLGVALYVLLELQAAAEQIRENTSSNRFNSERLVLICDRLGISDCPPVTPAQPEPEVP